MEEYTACPSCGEEHGYAYTRPVRCGACCSYDEGYAKGLAHRAVLEGDDARLATIGRAVVEFLMPNNPAALRQATPENVVEHLRRQQEELRSLQTCDALRVGRLVLTLNDALRPQEK